MKKGFIIFGFSLSILALILYVTSAYLFHIIYPLSDLPKLTSAGDQFIAGVGYSMIYFSLFLLLPASIGLFIYGMVVRRNEIDR